MKKIVVFIFGLFLASTVLALKIISDDSTTMPNQNYRGYKILGSLMVGVINTGQRGVVSNTTSFPRVKEFNMCAIVGNNNPKAIFIPTSTQTEWLSFLNRTPSNVTLDDCGCVNDADCLPGEGCKGYVAPSGTCNGSYTVTRQGICAGTVAGSTYEGEPGGPYEGMSCAGFSQDSCPMGWINHGCHRDSSRIITSTYSCSYLPQASCQGTAGCSRVGNSDGQMGTCEVCGIRGDWGSCSASCGGGTKYRFDNCGRYESYPCNTSPCAAYCGNGTCDGGETCSSCSTDCGSCPTTCFIAGTQVKMQDGTYKNIEDVQIGEKIIGQDNKINTVISYDRPNLGDRKLYSINNGPYFVTHEHPFMTIQGWKSINPEATWQEMPGFKILPLNVGDVLVKENGVLEYIWNIQSKTADSQIPLYNFKLNGNNTYYANGYLVHNKTYCGDGASCGAGYICDGTYCVPNDPPPGGCFVSGTRVTLADGRLVSIESVNTGDVLLGANGSYNIVERLQKHKYEGKLYSINDSQYFVSANHPFMTIQGWKSFNPQGSISEMFNLPISLLQVGDVLITDHGLVVIDSVKYIIKPQEVYNFTVSGDHTYYADGYLVHNSATAIQ